MSNLKNRFVICPTNCAPSTLAALDVNQSCYTGSDLYSAMITTIWMLSKKDNLGATNPLPSALTAAAFTALIDNTDTTGAKIKYLSVEGSMGAPAETIKKFQKKDIVTNRRYSVELTTPQMSDNTFNFIRKLECGGFDGYVWFGTEDHIFGGFNLTAGDTRIIELESLKGGFDFPTGDDTYQTGKITAVFDSLTLPARIARFI